MVWRSTRSRPARRGFHLARIGAAAIILSIACAAGPALPAPKESTPAAATPTAASSASANSSPGAAAGTSALKQINRAALQEVVDKAAREMLVPGAVVLLRTPQGELTFAFGTTRLSASTPPSSSTHFRIASNTKTMTAAVIVQLAQEGKLRLGDDASNYLPNVLNIDRITIAELLTMRSGLYNYTDAPALAEQIDRDPTKVWTAGELLAIALKQPPKFPPGTSFEYNNTNYALLGLIAEKVDAQPLARSMQARLFEPLGMQSTLLPASTSNALPEPYSHGYLYGSSSVALIGTPPYSPEFQAAARAGTILPKDYTNANHSFAAAAGGVVSNASDLATWIQALTSGRVFDGVYQRQWLASPQLEDPQKPDGMRYGFGIAQLHWGPNTMYFHGGETPGYNSFIGYDPTNKVTLVVWTNLTVSLDQSPTANSLMLKILDQIYAVSPLTPSQSPAGSN